MFFFLYSDAFSTFFDLGFFSETFSLFHPNDLEWKCWDLFKNLHFYSENSLPWRPELKILWCVGPDVFVNSFYD